MDRRCSSLCIGKDPDKKLTKKDKKYLTSRTTMDKKTVKEWHRGFMIDCPTGRMTEKVFACFYKMFFPCSDEVCEDIYQVFCQNQSHLMNFKEFVIAVFLSSLKKGKEKFKWIFKYFDRNNDGILEVEVVAVCFKDIYETIRAGDLTYEKDSKDQLPPEFFGFMVRLYTIITEEEFINYCLIRGYQTRILTKQDLDVPLNKKKHVVLK
ncbi:neuronal calcium sensor 2-like [Ischnura elegans]|uniref:neuronal calcium sensor 2-like n=1 Tax=Ischnura elegans TaxID=197161 RepID=UPI001ED867C4|nr:neuronal calcium sensor 2-like [Ischnura elegans]